VLTLKRPLRTFVSIRIKKHKIRNRVDFMENQIGPGSGVGAARFGRDDLRLFGHYVRERRTAGGITLRELADKSGVSIAAIRSLETGGANPSLSTVIQVIEALGTTIDRALAAVRAARGRVVVTRSALRAQQGCTPLSEGVSDAVLRGEVCVLPVESVISMPEAMTQNPSLCLVVDGALMVTTDAGDRVRVETGDTYHAEPHVVRNWANVGSRPVRLLCVADTRLSTSQEGREANT
jgi:transcriptional regulator with XRE-family HTH domain